MSYQKNILIIYFKDGEISTFELSLNKQFLIWELIELRVSIKLRAIIEI